MGSYYYLVAQLPYLVYGQPAPMSSEAFKSRCREMLSGSDAALLDFCTLDPEPAGSGGVLGDETVVSYMEAPVSTTSSFIDGWRDWERALRLNLARYRGQRLKWDGGAPVDPPEAPQEAMVVAKAAVMVDSPLEAEFLLDQSRWNAIESLQGIVYFSANTIYAYLLKLLLMERRSLFRLEEGFAEYKGLYAAIIERDGGNAPISIESGEPK
ncbi:MAG: DUF2764 domain-containing protein [Treponema sp.]|nr:DUF2764 domain-containing protein [Treponema sp.]